MTPFYGFLKGWWHWVYHAKLDHPRWKATSKICWSLILADKENRDSNVHAKRPHKLSILSGTSVYEPPGPAAWRVIWTPFARRYRPNSSSEGPVSPDGASWWSCARTNGNGELFSSWSIHLHRECTLRPSNMAMESHPFLDICFFSNALFAARQIAARQKGWGMLGRRLGMGRWDLDDYRWFSCLNAVPFNMFKTAVQAGGPSKPSKPLPLPCPNPCPKQALAFAHQRCHNDLDDGQHVEYVSVWKWATMKWQLE